MNERVRQAMADTVAALCDRIEAGSVGDWRMPWHHVGGDVMAPRSVKGHRYSGGNRVALAMAAMMSGYSAGTWATYKQWREVGGQVQTGQHGTPIVVFSQRERRPEPDEASGDETVDVVRFYKTITVFNVDQQQGWSPTAAQYLAHWLRVLRADPARLWTAARLAETAVEHLAACADRVAAATGPHCPTHRQRPTGPTAGALSITARLDQLEHRRSTPDRGLTQ
jgi:antirestriction protein ArdC